MNTQSPQPEKPGQSPTEKNLYRAQESAGGGTNWLVVVFKVIAFLVVGTFVLAALLLGTCFLLAR